LRNKIEKGDSYDNKRFIAAMETREEMEKEDQFFPFSPVVLIKHYLPAG